MLILCRTVSHVESVLVVCDCLVSSDREIGRGRSLVFAPSPREGISVPGALGALIAVESRTLNALIEIFGPVLNR